MRHVRKPEEPGPEENTCDQGDSCRDEAADHVEAVWVVAERNAPDVHAPDSRDQGCRQKNRRDHRQDVEAMVSCLFDLGSKLFEQELTVLRKLLRILDESC